MIVYGVVVAAMVLLFVTLPSSFLPDEDQGFMVALINLPTGAPESRTLEVGARMVQYFRKNEAGNVGPIFNGAGFNFAGQGQNLGQLFIRMKDWKVRKGVKNHAPAIAQRAMGAFSQERGREGVRHRPAGGPGTRQRVRFRPGARGQGGPRSRAAARGAQPVARHGVAGQAAGRRAAQRSGRYAPAPSRHRSRTRGRARPGAGRYLRHAEHRVGRRLRQQLHRPRPGEEGLFAG